jgi:hypothetical protein
MIIGIQCRKAKDVFADKTKLDLAICSFLFPVSPRIIQSELASLNMLPHWAAFSLYRRNQVPLIFL